MVRGFEQVNETPPYSLVRRCGTGATMPLSKKAPIGGGGGGTDILIVFL